MLASLLVIIPAALTLWTVSCAVTSADLCSGEEVPASVRDSMETD